jgi:diguanylate cyclase (GGDEF)-like protein
MVRGARRLDFAGRLKGRVRALRSRLEHPDAVIDAVRQSNATLDPQKVATWLVRQADEWIPAPCWAVIAHDVNGQLTVMSDHGLTPALGPSLWGADERGGPNAVGTVIAFPLICRQHIGGVLVGLDPVPSASAPALSPALVQTLLTLLEPAAIALDNALALQKAEALSVTDDLTRLYNPRYLHLVLRREAKRASRSGRPLSMLFIDMDGFKDVNTQHGHMMGSQALVEAGAIIRGSARETDVVARFGGDEFSVILPDTGREGAVAVAERIRDRIRAFRFLAEEGLSVHLTASIGVATLPDVAGSAEELLRAADKAMYRVKDTGKDGIHIAEEEGT